MKTHPLTKGKSRLVLAHAKKHKMKVVNLTASARPSVYDFCGVKARIKPCPFCGADGRSVHTVGNGKDHYSIECSSCKASRGGSWWPESDAIKYWNFRASESFMKEHDVVRATKDIYDSDDHIKPGQTGTIVHVYSSHEAYAVEFDGGVVVTASPDQIEPFPKH